jgi:hypothetical protein
VFEFEILTLQTRAPFCVSGLILFVDGPTPTVVPPTITEAQVNREKKKHHRNSALAQKKKITYSPPVPTYPLRFLVLPPATHASAGTHATKSVAA